MDERSLTYRGLAEATRKLDGKGITHAHINMLANGHDKPSMRAMELIAAACGVDPDYFAEYRLAAAMRELDPSEVGLEQALENLNARLGARRAVRRQSTSQRQLPQAQPRPTALVVSGSYGRDRRSGTRHRPHDPGDLNAPAGDLGIAPQHAGEPAREVAEFVRARRAALAATDSDAEASTNARYPSGRTRKRST